MGLDNYIYARGKNQKGVEFLERYFNHLKDDYFEDDRYEFSYMRKNWGIRNEIIRNIFHGEHDWAHDEDWDGHYVFKIAEIEKFVEIFAYFLNEEHWNDDANSIWAWHEGIPSIARTIADLRFLEEDTEEEGITDEDIELFFIDSY